MSTLSIKKRAFLMTIMIMFVTVFSVPHTAHAQSWGDNPASQIFKEMLSKASEIIKDIQHAFIITVLIYSMERQISHIVDKAGGSISGVSGWRDYLKKADDVAKVKTKNELAHLTRGGALNLTRDNGDSLSNRVSDIANSALSEKKFSKVSSTREFLRGNVKNTVNPNTGKSNVSNIAALTDIFSNPLNNLMAGQVAKDMYEEIREDEKEALILKQTGYGYNSKRPRETAATVASLRQETVSTALEGVTPLTRPIISTVLNRFMSGLSSKVDNGMQKVINAKNDLSDYYNKTGNSKQFEPL